MTTYVAYEPPERVFQDTLLAFQDFEMASSWSARIAPDPLGPVNKIVSLTHGTRRVGKSVLWRVPAGAVVEVRREEGAWTLTELFGLQQQMWDTRGYGAKPVEFRIIRAPGWSIWIDGREVLYVPDSEIWPPTPVKPVPWRLRAHRAVKAAVSARARAVVDLIAHRLGYVHESEARDW